MGACEISRGLQVRTLTGNVYKVLDTYKLPQKGHELTDFAETSVWMEGPRRPASKSLCQ